MTFMKVTTGIVLVVALLLSFVAAYFSVLGLMEIFSAAPQSVMVMAIVLEIAKVCAAFWAHINWRVLPATIKTYLVMAVIVLMGITSLGIYGFLAKAHVLQKAEISISYDTDISKLNARIANVQKKVDIVNQEIAVLDRVVDDASKRGYVTKSLQLNRKNQEDKKRLFDEKSNYEEEILELTQKRIEVSSAKEQSATKVGPIKYIANLVYGDVNSKQLDTAVRWLIIILIVVFDPLAIVLLISTGYIFSRMQNPIQREPVTVQRKPTVVVSNKGKVSNAGNERRKIS